MRPNPAKRLSIASVAIPAAKLQLAIEWRLLIAAARTSSAQKKAAAKGNAEREFTRVVRLVLN